MNKKPTRLFISGEIMSSLNGPDINNTANIHNARFSEWGKLYEFREPPFMPTTVQTSTGYKQFERYLICMH